MKRSLLALLMMPLWLPGAPAAEPAPVAPEMAPPGPAMPPPPAPSTAPATRSLAGEAIPRTAKGKDVVFNLSNAKLYDVIQQVAQLAGLNYTIDPAVKDGPVRIYMYGKLEKDGLEDVLGLALKLNGVAVIKNGDFLEFVPAAASRAAAPLIYGTQPSGEGGNSFAITQVIPFKFLDAEGFLGFLKEFMSQDGKAIADKNRNLLVIHDYQLHLRRVLAFVELMDRQPFEQKKLVFLRLKNSAPDKLLKELEPILKAANVPVGTSALQLLPIQSLNGILVVTQTPEWLPDLQGWIERFDDRPQSEGAELQVIPLRHAKAELIQPILAQVLRLPSGGATPSPKPSTPRSSLSRPFGSTGLSSLGGGTSGFSGTGLGGGLSPSPLPSPLGPTPGTPVANQTAAPVSTSASPNAPGESLMSENLSITVDTANNALLVFGSRRDIAIIEDAVAKLDLRPRQVLIEATILDLTLTGDFSLGFSGFLQSRYNAADIKVSGISEAGSSRDWRVDRPASDGAFTYTALAATRLGLLKLVLDAKDSKQNVRVLSQPRLWALDNQSASLQVQDEIPIPVNTYVPGVGTGGSGSNGYAVTNAQYLQTGLSLTVTPHINGSGVIRLEVQQEMSTSSGMDTLGSGQNSIQAPRISRRQLSTELIANDGETIVLGGLISQNNSESYYGLPILNRIPILRNLVSSQSRLHQRSELVILLTPRVVINEQDSERVTRELREKVEKVMK